MTEKSKQKQVFFADGLCLLVAAIWGTGFIASQMAIDAQMSAALIMALRFTMAAIIMILVCIPKLKKLKASDIRGGVTAGIFLFGAFYAQIVGQQNTTVSHCAFFTATNVVMVPFVVWLFTKRRPPLFTFAITALTLVGVTVLSIQPGSFTFDFNKGDALSLLCALLFALHISSLEWAAKDADPLVINMIQLTVAAVISGAVYFLTDAAAFRQADLKTGLPAVAYLGLMSTCLCYFLQTLAQKYTSASQAGVLLSTEGLFGSTFSVLLGMEALTVNLVAGGILIISSIVLMEVLSSRKKPAAVAAGAESGR